MQIVENEIQNCENIKGHIFKKARNNIIRSSLRSFLRFNFWLRKRILWLFLITGRTGQVRPKGLYTTTTTNIVEMGENVNFSRLQKMRIEILNQKSGTWLKDVVYSWEELQKDGYKIKDVSPYGIVTAEKNGFFDIFRQVKEVEK